MSRWNDYGFPDPEFLPWLEPMRGLWLALLERRAAAGAWPQLTGDRPAAGEKASAHDLRSFDSTLENTAEWYINHLATDFASFSGLPRWTWDDLAASIEGEFPDGVVAAGDIWLPEHAVIWARQRKVMIERLKYLEVPYLADTYSGHVHTGGPSSPEEAIAVAEANASIRIGMRYATIQCYIKTIWGPDHGWRFGSYCADIYQVGNLRVDEEMLGESGLTWDATTTRLYLYVEAPQGNADLFDAFGTGLTPGLNVLEHPFPSWTLPLQAERIWTPTPGRTYTFGFTSKAVCVADISEMFEFYDGE